MKQLSIKNLLGILALSCSLASSLHSVPTLRELCIQKIVAYTQANRALMHAALKNNLALDAQALEQAAQALEYRADPNVFDHLSRESALSLVCKGADVKFAELLLLHKADPNSLYSSYTAPLAAAVNANNINLCMILFAYEADPNIRADYYLPLCENSITPLHNALSKSLLQADYNLEIIRLLILNGAEMTPAITKLLDRWNERNLPHETFERMKNVRRLVYKTLGQSDPAQESLFSSCLIL